MANPRLLAIVTILVMTGTSGASQEEPSLNDLLTIEKLIDSGDWRGLYTYVAAKPNLVAGEGPLAVELRGFVDEVKRGQLTSFNAARNGASANGQTDPAGIY